MSIFKVGDTVECIDDKPHVYYSGDYINLILGKRYEVLKLSSGTDIVIEDIKNKQVLGWSPKRFKLVDGVDPIEPIDPTKQFKLRKLIT